MTVTRVFSYSIITDPDVFYSFFEKPLTTIEFSKLKDGTSYENIRYRIKPDSWAASELQCSIIGSGNIHFAGSGNSISVRSDAFSDYWSFSARDPDRPDVSCEAVVWFNQGISAGDSNISVASSTGKSEPFVLYTNKGFMGVVPDNPQETEFIFDNFSAVFSFETRFLRPPTTLNSSAALIAQISNHQQSRVGGMRKAPRRDQGHALLVVADFYIDP
jgi:hypothetical protein